jgi:DNA polymerase I - 3''-5'' exonuclease and polymerase domains
MTTVMEACSSATRGCVIAPKGKKLVVADLSNIEGRKLAWLAGEEWKLQAFRDFDTVIGWDDKKQKPIRKGFDLYILAYAKAFGCSPEDVDDFMRQIGKTMELALGYAGGVGAFITFSLAFNIDLELMAKNAWDAIPEAMRSEARDFMEWHISRGKSTYGLSEEAFIVCEAFKRLWREAHPQTVTYWKELENTCRDAINNPGRTFTCRRHKIRRDGAWLRVMLPSARYLCYPSPRVEDDGQITYMGINQYSRKWERLRTYSGKLAENCIAEGTEVLTEKFGWLAIERVTPETRVWDGDEWVSFSHCHYSGKQTTITTYSVRMTPGHLVFTEEGWRNASSCEGHNRAACRLPDGYTLPGVGRQEIDMGDRLRLREGHSYGPLPIQETSEERECFVMRVHAQGDDREAEHPTRDDGAPGLRSLAVNVGSVPTANASGLQKLWSAGYNRLRPLAREVRKLLGGHGPQLSSRVDYRTLGQFARLLESQLRMANHEASSEQSALQSFLGYPTRANDGIGSRAILRREGQHPGVSTGSRMAARTGADTRRVFDLVNCGPRSRFVVRGSDGLPLIVHNCCQASARDVLAYSLPSIEKAGYEIVLTVHDEIISEAPDTDEYTHEHLAELMSAGCGWTEGLPLAAAGFEAYRYRKG